MTGSPSPRPGRHGSRVPRPTLHTFYLALTAVSIVSMHLVAISNVSYEAAGTLCCNTITTFCSMLSDAVLSRWGVCVRRTSGGIETRPPERTCRRPAAVGQPPSGWPRAPSGTCASLPAARRSRAQPSVGSERRALLRRQSRCMAWAVPNPLRYEDGQKGGRRILPMSFISSPTGCKGPSHHCEWGTSNRNATERRPGTLLSARKAEAPDPGVRPSGFLSRPRRQVSE